MNREFVHDDADFDKAVGRGGLGSAQAYTVMPKTRNLLFIGVMGNAPICAFWDRGAAASFINAQANQNMAGDPRARVAEH